MAKPRLYLRSASELEIKKKIKKYEIRIACKISLPSDKCAHFVSDTATFISGGLFMELPSWKNNEDSSGKTGKKLLH